ncbi:short-chain dehydrogenase [Reticulibacter mediterranei]|uniref:Short-chain dehydrogenase n=1 Tax=Reticulibacter mediterranei TaxID=2778369 RepID=A0A8J3ICU4_9CHLR|nr:SDR family oxidoreductase [Reticulibacter mediterranei]GHO91961.1 short-chain dehydrogenase [Reticulibacter mediterranei]
MGVFDGKVAIVTGAARGLGRDYTRFFLQDGANVVLADIQGEAVEANARELQATDRVLAVSVDVTSPTSANTMAEQAMKAFGHIDILVNNAAIWGDLRSVSLLEIDTAYWDTVLDVNLKGALLCSQAVIPFMSQQKWGRIVNISSGGAYKPGSVYSVSKLALNQLTYSLAQQVADAGITCNAIAPGPIYNEAVQRQYTPEAFERIVQQGMIKRAGTSKDIYGCLRYLCSDDAEWVTAQILHVNGGAMSRL